MILLRWVGIRDHLPTRAGEWLGAAVLLTWGILLLGRDGVFVRPGYTMLLTLAPQWVWGCAAGGLGLARLAILAINGGLRRSPHLRSAAAALSCFFWLQISLSFFAAGQASQNLAVSVLAVYPALLALDIYNTLRAARDARRVDDEVRQLEGGHLP